jgi:predicted dehydrogenase
MTESGTAPRVTVVGCGQIADAHVREARRAGAIVAAVCDLSPHLAEQAAARLGVPAWFSDLEAMLERTRPGIVHVTTPPATHLGVARRALAAGAHVYVEKPLTVDAAEADALAAAAQAADRLVCVGHNLVFDPAVRRLRSLVAEGALGEVVHAEATMAYDLGGPFGALLLADPLHWLHRLPGGLAQNNLSHPLSLVLPLLGPGLPEVHAIGRRLRRERFGDARDRFDDEVRALLVGERATATVTFSCRLRPVQLSLVVYGSRRSAVVSIDARTVRLVDGSRAPGPFQKVDWARRDAVAAGRELVQRAGDLARARLHYFEGMRALFRAFHAAAAGAAPPPIPLAEACATAEVMDRIFAAARRGEGAAPREALA